MGKRWNRFVSRAGTVAKNTAFVVAPRAYSRRVRLRRALDLQERLFATAMPNREAGDSDRLGGSGWLASQLSPDSDLERSLDTYRERARDLYYDNPLFHGWIEGCVNQVVGKGSTPQSRIKEGPRIGADRVDDLKKQAEAIFGRWGLHCDLTARRSFTEIQRLVERLFRRDGECFVVRSDVRRPSSPIPLALEVVEGARCETPPDKEGQENVRLGIERDRYGAPVAYYFRTVSPNDTKDLEERHVRVPAERVCHVFEQEDANQSRGVPRGSSAMRLLREIDYYEKAVRVKRQVEACATLFVTTLDPLGTAIGDASGTTDGSKRLKEINPGTIHYGQPGEEPKFLNPGEGAGYDHAAYIKQHHHVMAAGLQYPFELLTKSYGGTNYASGRLSLIDGRIAFRADQKLRQEQLLSHVWRWVMEEAVLAGLIDVDAAEFLADPDAFLAHTWIPQGWPWVDPVKEIQASRDAVNADLDSRANVVAGQGQDDEELQEQRLREKKRDADNEAELKKHREQLGLDKDEESTSEDVDQVKKDQQGEQQARIAADHLLAKEIDSVAKVVTSLSAAVDKQAKNVSTAFAGTADGLAATREALADLCKTTAAQTTDIASLAASSVDMTTSLEAVRESQAKLDARAAAIRKAVEDQAQETSSAFAELREKTAGLADEGGKTKRHLQSLEQTSGKLARKVQEQEQTTAPKKGGKRGG